MNTVNLVLTTRFAFSAFPVCAGTNVVNELEKRLGQIEVITGALLIRRAKTLVSLNFLKKLRQIDGETDGLETG